MKKLKKVSTDKVKIGLFKPEIKCSRVTIDSRVCNIDKFNEFFQILDHAQVFKNTVSSYCFTHLTKLVTNYSDFLTNYKTLKSKHLNSWEKQTIFAEVAGDYFETTTRHLSKAQYIVQKQSLNKNAKIQYNYVTKVKTRLTSIAELIDKNSNLINKENIYKIDFDITAKLTSLNNYLVNYQKSLNKILIQNKSNYKNNRHTEDQNLTKEIIRLEKLIVSYHKIVKTYEEIEQFSLTKPAIYNRIINLVTTKKLRLLRRVKLSVYKTGTHARHLDNAQLSIVKDTTNSQYQYFLKVRKFNKLDGREPQIRESNQLIITKEFVEELKVEQRLKNNIDYENKINHQVKLAKYNEDNFIYLPLIFNHEKLKQIGKKLDTILTKNNPQILLKSEQLRIGSKSRKIHLIFNYEEKSKLGEIIENNQFVVPDEQNTIGFDVNLKHNLLADSNGLFYDEILNPVNNNENISLNKNKFLDNLNEIVLLQSIEVLKRTQKQKYRYEKLLRCNESLLKTYLSGLIKDWKSQDITHLVLEDLNLIGDKSYYEHQNVKIKHSRLARLLRLSQIKLWVSQMAEKQGLFTHLVNPAYTSQECSKCHFISRLNRTKQENFKCTNKNCLHEMNADSNSALNIKNRILHKELRAKLNKDNVYLCSRVKPIYYKNVKTIITDVFKDSYNYEVYKNGVLTRTSPQEYG